jgi:hypothetical protein
MRLLENRMLRRLLGPKRDKMPGGGVENTA